MSLPLTPADRLSRMAILKPERVELIHPMTPSHMLVGWSILKDECWNIGDGLDLVRTIERKAGIKSWRKMELSWRGL